MPAVSTPVTSEQRKRWRVALTVGWLLALLALAVVGLRGVWRQPPAKDFAYFYAAGQYWREHHQPAPSGHLGHLAWYQPFTLRCVSLLSYLPARWAGTAWVLGNLGCLWVSAWLVGRAWHGHGWRRELPAIAALTLYLYVQFDVNQFAPVILLLLVYALTALQAGRSARAGAAIGVAALLKLAPALLVLWCALKRRWSAVASAVLVVLLLGPALDAVQFGPRQAWRWQVEWMQRIRYSGSSLAVLQAGEQCDYGNHSAAAVLRRLLHADQVSGSSIVDWPMPAITATWVVLMAAGSAVLVWTARRPASRLSTERLRWEFALWCLGLLWFMPVVRQYHLLWAYPAVSLLLGQMASGWLQRPRLRSGTGAAITLAVWVLLMAVGWPASVQQYPVTLVGMIALGCGLIVGMRGLAPVGQAAGEEPTAHQG
jgi:hypothetical protein